MRNDYSIEENKLNHDFSSVDSRQNKTDCFVVYDKMHCYCCRDSIQAAQAKAMQLIIRIVLERTSLLKAFMGDQGN